MPEAQLSSASGHPQTFRAHERNFAEGRFLHVDAVEFAAVRSLIIPVVPCPCTHTEWSTPVLVGRAAQAYQELPSDGLPLLP